MAKSSKSRKHSSKKTAAKQPAASNGGPASVNTAPATSTQSSQPAPLPPAKSQAAMQPATPPAEKSAKPPAPAADAPPSASTSSVAVTKAAGRRRRIARRSMIVLTLLIALFGAGYWYLVLRPVNIAQQNQNIINEVSRLAVVPENEIPAVTSVVDETKVNQEFLRTAKKGDKVLLYFQAGRAIVYRPSTHQIVNMGPLETPKPRVFIRNGASSNFTDDVVAKINGSADFLLASRDESAKRDYAKTVVVDVTGTRPDVAQRLAKFLGVSVVTMPDNEFKPDADMLVIIGNDYRPANNATAEAPASSTPPAAQPASGGPLP